MEKHQKAILWASVLMLFFVGIAIRAEAADTTVAMTRPVSSGIVNGSYNITATVTYGGADKINLTHCNFSQGSTIFLTVRGQNYTVYQNATLTSTSMTESTGSTITVKCFNSSNMYNITDSATSVVVDNSAPTCSFTSQYDNIERMTYNMVDGTASSDTYTDSSLTYSFVLTKPSGTTSSSTSSTHDFATTDFDELGTYTIDLAVMDGAGHNTSCTQKTIWVQQEGSNTNAAVIQEQEEQAAKTGNKTILIIVVVCIVVLIAGIGAVVAVMDSAKKTKRRRR